MWTYVLRRSLYAIPILFGVLLLTFAIFYTIQTPEDLSRAKFSKGGNENQVAGHMRSEGYAELNQVGEKKLEIFNQVVANKMSLSDLQRSLRGMYYGKYDKDTGAYDETAIDVTALTEKARQGLKDAEEARLRGIETEAKPKDEALKAALDAAQLAYDAGLEKSKGDATAPALVKLKEVLDAADKAKQEADKTHTEAISAAIKPALDAYQPSDNEVRDKIIEQDEMVIGTYETRRYSMAENFVNYLTDLLTFTFKETNDKRKVSDVLIGGMGPSLMLMLPAFFISEFLGVFFGLFAALFRNTKIDRTLVISSVVLMSVTPVAFIIFAQKFFAADWQYFPVSGFRFGPGAYAYLALPILIYVLITIGGQIRFNRIIMLDEVGQDYVRTAKSKGLSRNAMLFKHVLRNSLIPLITRWAVAIPNLYLGSLLLESFFAIPGLGGITVQAVQNTDINLIRALVFIGTIIYIFATLLSDVLYAVVDPRVKLS